MTGPHDADGTAETTPGATTAGSVGPIWQRRRVLAGVGAVVAVGAIGVTTAGTVPGASTLTVWKLEIDWGYPRGPHSKTSLRSRASRRAATHRYAVSRADAEAMNLHECSWAPAYPVSVDAAAFTRLWDGLAYDWTSPWSGDPIRIFDDRHVNRIGGGAELLRQALGEPMGAPTSPGGPPSPDAGTSAPADLNGQGVTGATGGAGGTNSSTGSTLAFTGAETGSLVAAAAAAIAAGVIALRSRRGAGGDVI